MDEFSRPTKWMQWLLSITCFDEFHEYESLCNPTQWFFNDSSGNCAGLRKRKNDSSCQTELSCMCQQLESFSAALPLRFCQSGEPRPDALCLSAQVCPPPCQAFCFSFSTACWIIFISAISYSSGEDNTSFFHSLGVMKTQGSHLAGKLQHF